MRVTIESAVDTLVLPGVWQGVPWVLLKDGLGGWYEPPAPRVDVHEVPQQDGSYYPSQLLTSHRILTIRGGALTASSSLEGAACRRRVSALQGRTLDICVEDSSGPLWVQGFVSSQIEPTVYPSERDYTFTLIITCPDPAKYGTPVTQPLTGTVAVENTGDYPVWPAFTVEGPVSVWQVTADGRTLRWEGSAPDGFTLDARTGIPVGPDGAQVGVLVVDELFQIEPGTVTLSVSGDAPGGSVTARPAWL